ncbi:hypothetical protein AB0C31_41965, partial [Actinoplanes philippinensis]
MRRFSVPSADVPAFADVLADPALGGFETAHLRDPGAGEAYGRVKSLFEGRDQEDCVLLYFRGVMLTGPGGGLYLAASDTVMGRPADTGIDVAQIAALLQRSRAEQAVVLLDGRTGGPVDAGHHFRAARSTEGQSRVVIAATPRPEPPTFAGMIAEGVTGGAADRDRDGWIGISELYDHLRERDPSVRQWVFGSGRQPWLARVRRPGSDQMTLIAQLAVAAAGNDLSHAVEAREALRRLAIGDGRVAAAATAALRRTSIRIAEPSVDFGRVAPGTRQLTAEVPVQGPPLAAASVVSSTVEGLHARLEGNLLRVSWFPTVGRLGGAVTLDGPAGSARLTVTGEVSEDFDATTGGWGSPAGAAPPGSPAGAAPPGSPAAAAPPGSPATAAPSGSPPGAAPSGSPVGVPSGPPAGGTVGWAANWAMPGPETAWPGESAWNPDDSGGAWPGETPATAWPGEGPPVQAGDAASASNTSFGTAEGAPDRPDTDTSSGPASGPPSSGVVRGVSPWAPISGPPSSANRSPRPLSDHPDAPPGWGAPSGSPPREVPATSPFPASTERPAASGPPIEPERPAPAPPPHAPEATPVQTASPSSAPTADRSSVEPERASTTGEASFPALLDPASTPLAADRTPVEPGRPGPIADKSPSPTDRPTSAPSAAAGEAPPFPSEEPALTSLAPNADRMAPRPGRADFASDAGPQRDEAAEGNAATAGQAGAAGDASSGETAGPHEVRSTEASSEDAPLIAPKATVRGSFPVAASPEIPTMPREETPLGTREETSAWPREGDHAGSREGAPAAPFGEGSPIASERDVSPQHSGSVGPAASDSVSLTAGDIDADAAEAGHSDADSGPGSPVIRPEAPTPATGWPEPASSSVNGDVTGTQGSSGTNPPESFDRQQASAGSEEFSAGSASLDFGAGVGTSNVSDPARHTPDVASTTDGDSANWDPHPTSPDITADRGPSIHDSGSATSGSTADRPITADSGPAVTADSSPAVFVDSSPAVSAGSSPMIRESRAADDPMETARGPAGSASESAEHPRQPRPTCDSSDTDEPGGPMRIPYRGDA